MSLLAALAAAGGCSLSLDGDHFRGDPEVPADAGAGGSAIDASDPEHSRPPRDPDAAPEADAAPDPADTCGETCVAGDCDLHCPDQDCDCELDCAATSSTCKAKCEHEDCAIDCIEVDKCEAGCKDSTCTIDCTGARECDHVKCEEESGCLLDCTGAERCEFERCNGEVVTSCPGDILACNRACP